MSGSPLPLTFEDLLAHARAAARSDEERHRAASDNPKPNQHSEDTVRGWGGASLRDVEWTSSRPYTRDEQQEYRRVYAEEYRLAQLARATRTAQ